MNKCFFRLQSQKGQGLVEYVLLLVVVIAIALLLANRIFKPVQKWMEFYIGSYVECLLDQGELPGLGGESGVKDCEFDNPFSDADNKNAKDASRSDRSQAKEDSKKSSNSNQQSGRGGVIITQPSGRQIHTRIGGLDNGAGDDKTTVAAEAGKSDGANGYLKINRAGGVVRYSLSAGGRVRGLSGLLEAEREKLKKREQKISKVANVGDEIGESKNGRKVPIKEELRRRKESEVSFEGFSFGKFFRIFLIIVIAIALILFVAGQLSQISKSMEK